MSYINELGYHLKYFSYLSWLQAATVKVKQGGNGKYCPVFYLALSLCPELFFKNKLKLQLFLSYDKLRWIDLTQYI